MGKKWNHFKKMLWRLVVFSVLIASLSGCGVETVQQPDEEDTNLWIVTNNSGMKLLIDEVSERFVDEHPNITVTVDTGPKNREEWDVYLEQTRVQIMAGNGPDLYLFASENVTSQNLVTDVNQFMRNGLFWDITEYYDNDNELNKDGLVSAVMDAGVVNGSRYVLPLRYNFPVIYADVQQLNAAGLRVEDLRNGLSGLVDVVKAMGDNSLSSEYGSLYFYLYWMNYLPELINYDTQEVELDKEELAVFLEEYRNLINTGISDSYPSLGSYITQGNFWALEGKSIYLSTLNTLVQNLKLAKATDIELAVIPVTASDGALIANVSYYGAVGANSNTPELAYTFLREFLLEENQWENNLGDIASGLIEGGWPVLTKGSGIDLSLDLLRSETVGQLASEEANRRRTVVKHAEMTEEDFMVLDTQIDAVRFFPITQADYMIHIDSQLNLARNPDAMNVDVDNLAKELIQSLQWHVAEG